jgi:hypothetical protein
VQLELKRSVRQFKFCDDVRQSIGHMQIQIPTPDSVLNISVDVVDMDVPLLIGLCYALLRMRPLSIPCAECSVVISARF